MFQPSQERHLFLYGDKHLKVSDTEYTVHGVEEESSASTFRIEWNSNQKEFMIVSDIAYMISEEGSIKVKPRLVGERATEPLLFSFADAETTRDWIKYGSRIKINALDGFLGYNEKSGSLEMFPSDAKEKQGEVSLWCSAKGV